METYPIELTPEEYERLNLLYPESAGSGLIGKRAEEIVRIHVQRCSPGCTFVSPDPGADLKVLFCDGAKPLLIEVKGTAAQSIAWPQLKVSSRHSHKLLVDGGIPVYRVSDVFALAPIIYVLRHGVDFELEEEARWAFKPLDVPREDTATQQLEAIEQETLDDGTAPVEGMQTSKYDALRRYLERRDEEQVTLAFTDALDILGFSLPASAYKHQAFWANQTNTTNRPWARAWQAAGYEVEAHRLSDNGWVRFRRRH